MTYFQPTDSHTFDPYTSNRAKLANDALFILGGLSLASAWVLLLISLSSITPVIMFTWLGLFAFGLVCICLAACRKPRVGSLIFGNFLSKLLDERKARAMRNHAQPHNPYGIA